MKRNSIHADRAVRPRTITTTRHLLFRRACLWTGFLAFAMIAFGPQPAHAAVTEAWVQRYSNVASSTTDEAVKVVRDAAGDIIVTGSTAGGILGADMLTIKYSGADGSVLWQQRYNGPANSDDRASALAVDGSRNVVVTGYSLEKYTTAKFYMAKYAAVDGVLLWEKRHNSVSETPSALAVDGSDNVVVTRTLYGTTAGGIPVQDLLTIKYSGVDGSVLWQQRYNGPANGRDQPSALAVDGSGNVAVTGVTYNYTGPDGSFYGGDYYTAKYAAADGALLWEKRYNGPANSDDRASALAVDGSGNVVVTGYSFNGTNSDYYTAKYAAADGTLLWEKRDSEGGGGPTALAVDGSGNVVVTGSSSNTNYTSSDYYTAKYAATNGELLWEKRYNGRANDHDFATAMAVDGSGNVVVTGVSNSRLTRFGYVEGDYYTAKYAAADGALLWEQTYNGPANSSDSASSLTLGPNGMVVVAGTSVGATDYDYATVVYREVLPAISIDRLPTGVRLRFAGVPGRSYNLERAPAVTGPWSTINTQTATASGLFEYLDTLTHSGSGFYRIVQP
jgi:hypothetical protein